MAPIGSYGLAGGPQGATSIDPRVAQRPDQMVPFSMVEPVASEQNRALQGPKDARARAIALLFLVDGYPGEDPFRSEYRWRIRECSSAASASDEPLPSKRSFVTYQSPLPRT